MRGAILLDKDGTIVVDVPYNADPACVQLLPGAADGLRQLHSAGYALAVVSNQSGVARGRFPFAALTGIEQRLRELLLTEGVPLAGCYWCPHLPDGGVAEYTVACDCRKPAPGLLRRALADLGVDAADAWMIGDKEADVEAGRAAGCRTLRVGGEVADLREASRVILVGESNP